MVLKGMWIANPNADLTGEPKMLQAWVDVSDLDALPEVSAS